MVQNNDVSFSLFKQLALNVAVTVFTSRRLVKSCLNPKRISYSIELMVLMLSILSTSDARSSHRLILRMSPWMLMGLCRCFFVLSYFVKLHDIKHLEKNSINIAVPTLMEVPITPMGYGVILIFERVIDFIHRGTLSC